MTTGARPPRTGDVPSPLLPEPFKGYRDLVATEQTRYTGAQQLGDQLQGELKTLREAVLKGQDIPKRKKPPLWVGLAMPPSPNLVLPLASPLMGRRETDTRMQTLASRIEAQLGIMQESSFRLHIANPDFILPLMEQGHVHSVDDVLEIVYPAGTPARQVASGDREFIQQMLNNYQPLASRIQERVTTQPPDQGLAPEVTRRQEIVKILQAPRTGRESLYAWNPTNMTATEIMDKIVRSQRYTLPAGTSPQEALRELQGVRLSPEQVQELRDSEVRNAVEIAGEARTLDAKIAVLRRDYQALSIEDLASELDKGLLIQALARPAGLIFAPFEYWAKHIANPIAGFSLEHVLGVLSRLGVATDQQEAFRSAHQDARQLGMDSWASYRYVWEHWEANGALRFLAGMGTDPLSYLGLGVLPAATAPIPALSRTLGAAERGYVRAAELPFDMLKRAWVGGPAIRFLPVPGVPRAGLAGQVERVLTAELIPPGEGIAPRTLAQRGEKLAEAMRWDLRVLLESTSGLPLERIPQARMIEILTESIGTAIKQPLSPDRATRLGKALLGSRTVTREEVQGLLANLSITGREVTPDIIEHFSTLLDYTQGGGYSVLLRPSMAAGLMLNRLNVAQTTFTLKTAESFFTTKLRGMQRRALNRLTGDTPQQVIDQASRYVRDSFVEANRGVIAARRYQEGVLAHGLHGIEAVSKWLIVDGIDRWVTQPFARSYLLFGGLALYNKLEMMGKFKLAGINPALYRGSGVYSRAGNEFYGVTGNVPASVLLPSKFELQVAPPSGDWREANTAQQTWMMQFMTGRWIKNINPKLPDLQQLTGYDWMAAQASADRSAYWLGMYSKLLTEREPDAISAIDRLVTEGTQGLETVMSKEVAKGYRLEIAARLRTGDLAWLAKIPETFSPNAIRQAELTRILQDLDLVSAQIGPLLGERLIRGELYAKGPAGINRLFNTHLRPMLQRQYMESPAFFEMQFGDAVRAFIDWEPRTMAELNYKLITIGNVVEMFSDTIHLSVSSATRSSRYLATPQARDNFLDGWWTNNLMPMINSTEQRVAELVASTKAKMSTDIVRDLTLEQQSRYDSLLTAYLRKTEIFADARRQYQQARLEFFTPGGASYTAPGRGRNNLFWDGFRDRVESIWDTANISLTEHTLEATYLQSVISGLSGGQIVDVGSASLSSTHIADLFGSTPDQLRRNMYMPELMSLRGKPAFTSLVYSRAKTMASLQGRTPEELGYSTQAIEAVYERIVDKLKGASDIDALMAPTYAQLEQARQEIIRLGMTKEAFISDDSSKYLTDTIMPRLNQAAEQSSDPAVQRLLSPEWQQVRRDVLDEVNFRWAQDMPDYDNQTAIDTLMRLVYPFWTYEAHRWAWWTPREFTRHPGAYMAVGRYRDNTDEGYVHIPGTSLDANFLRGTIFMGAYRRLFQRDYPEFYDRFSGLTEVLDSLSRFGFYPGPTMSITLATFGSKAGWHQWGELVPPWGETVLGAMGAVLPDEFSRFMRDIFPDRFKDVLIARQASSMGYDGTELLNKPYRGEKLSSKRPRPEELSEQEQWDRAARQVDRTYTVLAEQTGIFRLNPEQRIRVNQAAVAMQAKYYGVSEGFIRDLRRRGLLVSEVFEPSPPELQRALDAIDGYRAFTGQNIVLGPSQLAQEMLIQTEFWDNVRVHSEGLNTSLASFETELGQGKWIMQDWLREVRDVQKRRVDYITSLGEKPRYKDIPKTIDQRVAFALEHHMPEPIFHPVRELTDLWFEEPLQDILDPDTGTYEPDWLGFFARQQAIEDAVRETYPELWNEFELYLTRNSTPLMRVYKAVTREFIRPYEGLFQAVLEQFPPEDQRVIKRYYKAKSSEAASAEQEVLTTLPGYEGAKLISTFVTLRSRARENLRTVYPELDAWLLVFKKVYSPRTPEAAQLEQEYMKGLGLPTR